MNRLAASIVLGSDMVRTLDGNLGSVMTWVSACMHGRSGEGAVGCGIRFRTRMGSLFPWFLLAGCWILLALGGRLNAEPLNGQALSFGPGKMRELRLPVPEFSGAQDLTFEGWVRFDSFGRYSRFFDYGKAWNSIAVTHHETSPNLMFEVWASETERSGIHVTGLLRSNEWCHIAASCGPSGMRLFFNGLLIATNSSTLGVRDLQPSDRFLLGRGSWDIASDRTLRGAIAEFRVWNTARTAEEISAGYLERVGKSTPGLLGRWSLDGPSGVSPDGRDVPPIPENYFQPLKLPAPDRLAHPAIISGTVTDPDGKPVNLAQIRLWRGGNLLAVGRSGTDGWAVHKDVAAPGRFWVAVYVTNRPLSLLIAHPAGRTNVDVPPLASGERRELNIRLPLKGANLETTNAFTRGLAAELQSPVRFVRLSAIDALAANAKAPGAATALASAYELETDPEIREAIGSALENIAPQSHQAATAVLEADEALSPELIRKIRKQAVPPGLTLIYTRRSQAIALLFGGILGSFAVLHLFFFLCDRRNKSDGFNALFTGFGAAGTIFSEWGEVLSPRMQWLGAVLLAISYLSGLRLVYSLFSERVPLRFYLFNIGYLASGIVAWRELNRGGFC